MPDLNQPQPGSHEAAMLAKVDATHAAALAASTPVPMSTPPAQDPPKDDPKPADEPAKTPPAQDPPADDPAAQAAKSAGLDFTALTSEFTEKGALSEASYEALNKVGISKDVVDSHIAGQQALAAQRDNEGYALVGGKDQFTAMGQWASANMQPAEIDAFNKAVTSGSQAEMKQAILGLKASYEAALGSEPRLMSGQRGGTPDAVPFASRAEVTAAMRDRRYATDPAYRAQVEQRIALMDNF